MKCSEMITKPGCAKHRASCFSLEITIFALLILLLSIPGRRLQAEGTRQLAPNPEEIVMLLIDNDAYGNFGVYDGPEESRFYFRIDDPGEVVYLGLSRNYRANGAPESSGSYNFRIRRLSDGAVVHGPFTIHAFNENISNWEDAVLGPAAVTGEGYETTDSRFFFDPSQAGDYFIEFEGASHIGFWDVTVANNGQIENGRVFSKNWAFRTPTENNEAPECVWDREFNGILYSYTSDGFVTRIDFSDSGFQGLSFNVAFNRTGPGVSGDLQLDRMSVEGENLTENSAEHLIFLNEPDPFLFPDGACGSATVEDTFLCTDEGDYCLEVTTTQPGQVEIVLDFNKNGVFDADLDIRLLEIFDDPAQLTTCLSWNGLKGDGTPPDGGASIDLLVQYTQGVQHWALFDGEFLKNGFCVEPVRPICDNQQSNLLFWDDRNIPDDPGTGAPKDGRLGCDCTDENCRTWNYFDPGTDDCRFINDNITLGYGDKSTLNTWWFARNLFTTVVDVPFPAGVSIEGETEICEGETITLSLVADNADIESITWEGPEGIVDEGGSENTAIDVSVPGLYTVRVLDSNGCTATAFHELTIIDCPVDVAIDKMVDILEPEIGQVLTYTIALTNDGPGTATGITLEDQLPDGLTNISGISNAGALQGDRIIWNDLILDEGETIVLTYRATVIPGLSYTNLAEVTALDQDDLDSTPGNGVDTNGNGDVSDDPGDEDDGDGVVLLPQPCSLVASVENIICDDNGTPVDPSDDTFTFELTVDAANASDGWVADDGPGTTGSYGQSLQFGPFPIAEGTVNFEIQDQFFGALCSTAISVPPPATCSDQCLIETEVTNVLCNDNGTPSDPGDDTFTFDLTVVGFNSSDNWTADGQSAPFGATLTFGPFLISEGPRSFTVLDSGNDNCRAEVVVQAPPTCSGQCVIEASADHIICDDNGTPSIPEDDVYFFDLLVTGANVSDQGWSAGNGLEGTYDEVLRVGPLPIDGGALTLELRDKEDMTCTTTLSVEPPATCSDECMIIAQIVAVRCEDAGTPSDPADDLFYFDITATGFNIGAGWTSNLGQGGDYGDPVTFGPFLISEGAFALILTDRDDESCRLTMEIQPPPTCSNTCDITATVEQIYCDDNGTGTDPTDDVFFADILVSGSNTSTDGFQVGEQSGQYDVPLTVGPFPIADGAVSLEIADQDDPDCTATVQLTPPAETCSDECAIEAGVEDVLCQDNGTPSLKEDDLYTFEVMVNGLNNPGAGWVASDGTSGNFGEPVTFGPYPIREGDKTILIRSVDFPDCQFAVTAEAPEPCSDQCLIDDVELLAVVCDDNGTLEDASDDAIVYTVVVNGLNLSGSWIADDGTMGAYGVPVVSVPHSVAEGKFEVTISDSEDPDCQYTFFVAPPPVYIECPENTARSTVRRNALILEGAVEEADARFDDVESLCWLPGDLFEEGDHYYDLYTLRYNSDSEEPEVFTFYLFSDIPGNSDLTLGLDGAGGLFLGPYYPDDPCCFLQSSDVRALPSEVGSLLDNPLIDPSGLFSQNYEAIAKFSALMTPNQAYSLITTTFIPEVEGRYAWLILSEPGVELEVVNGDVDLEERREMEVGMALTFFDRDVVLDNPASIDALGHPILSSYCGIDSITFDDRVTDLGECTDLIINRQFKVYGYGFTDALDSCEQEITLRQLRLDDIVLPPEAVLYACGAEYDTLANGLPAPSAAGFPLVLTQSGYVELTESFNYNLTIAYKDNLVDIPGGFTETFQRDWTITDICADTVLRYSQLIKIGGFTDPIVECPLSNHFCPILEDNIMLFPMDPFACSATIEAPLPDIINTCGEQDWLVRTEVIQVVAGDTLVLAVFEPGEARVLSELPPGDYLFRYTVFDLEGHQVEKLCVFRVADTQEPSAICRTDVEVFIAGDGDRTLSVDEINQGSYDNCGVATVEIRRLYRRDPVSCDTLSTPDYSEWGETVSFGCCDLGQYVTVEMRVTDIYGIENTCWLDILVQPDANPEVTGAGDRSVNCSELPDDFHPQDQDQLAALFGMPQLSDECGAAIVELAPDVQLSDCGAGVLVRQFQAAHGNGQVFGPLMTQTITITDYLEYEINFPPDVVTDCADWSDTVRLQKTACDSLEVSYTDEFLEPIGEECYRLARTYRVVSYCEWDGESEAVTVGRDEDCDGNTGGAAVWVLRRPEGAFIDADTNENNNLPPAAEKGPTCDGTTNPAGYWRAVESTGLWVYTQEIRVFDEQAPVMTAAEPEPFCTEGPECTAPVSYPFTVDDACVLETLEALTIEWDADADGTIDSDLTESVSITGVYPNFIVEGDFPIGDQQLLVTATDRCGNSASLSLPFSVVDCFVPELDCPESVTVDLAALATPTDLDGDGTTEVAGLIVTPDLLLNLPENDCTAPLRFSINRVGEMPDINRVSLGLTCNDRYRDSLEVYLWDSAYNPYLLQPDGVTVGGPNYERCRVELYIQDPEEVCPDCTANPVVGGTITTEEGMALPDVDMEVNQLIMDDMEVTADGAFHLEGLQPGGPYTFAPRWDEGHRNGLTTLDLLLARAHLLGVKQLESPYRMIAADVNRSGSITAADLLEMRQLVLGELDRFTNNTSWRFVDKRYDFPDDRDPWREAFPEYVLVEDLLTCKEDLDFAAIKVGDLNGSARFEATAAGEARDYAPAVLRAPDAQLAPGESVWLPVELENAQSLRGFQFTLSFDPQLVELEAFEPGLLDRQHLGLRFAGEGALTFSWDQREGRELRPGSALEVFRLKIKARAVVRLSDVIRMTSRITPAEAYRDLNTSAPIALHFIGTQPAVASLKLFQNRPNPFHDHTIVGFELPESGDAELLVIDVSGRQVWRRSGVFAAGYNELRIATRDLPGNGLYYYLLRTAEGTLSRKLVVAGRH